MIITTTDGSVRSFKALPQAAFLAETLGLPLSVLEIFDPSGITARHGIDNHVRLREEIEERQAAMRLMMTEAAIQPEAECEPLLKGENVADAILRTAADRNAHMLAMDTRGHGLLRHGLLGSVAMDILARTSMPLMLTGPEVLPPRTAAPYVVLVTSDGSPASELVFSALSRLPGRQHLRFVLASVYVPTTGDRGDAAEIEGRQQQLERLRQQYLGDTRCDFVVRIAREFTTAEIIVLELAAEKQATAIAMSTHGHSAARHVLLGSFAAAVLSQSPLPLILARA